MASRRLNVTVPESIAISMKKYSISPSELLCKAAQEAIAEAEATEHAADRLDRIQDMAEEHGTLSADQIKAIIYA